MLKRKWVHRGKNNKLRRGEFQCRSPLPAQREKGTSPLHVACNFEDLEKVEELLNTSSNPNICDTSGVYPLHLAVFKDSLEITKTLVAFGADTNVKNNRGYTPLAIACKQGSFRALRFLIQRGGSVNQVCPDGTLFMAAYASRQMSVMLELLKHGADPGGNSGMNALHVVARNGSVSTLEALLGAGIAVNARTSEGKTPLHLALEHKNLKVFQTLVMAGGDVNMACNRGLTPLFCLVERGDTALVSWLLEVGCELSSTHPSYPPLHLACQRGNLKMVRLLLDGGASTEETNAQGKTPLQTGLKISFFSNQREIISLLISRGAWHSSSFSRSEVSFYDSLCDAILVDLSRSRHQ